VATVNLSFLNRRTINKQVCRICQEFTELKSDCAVNVPGSKPGFGRAFPTQSG